ncbi:hypothetical protein AJ80_04634 [Polytolypa hystricis UAMH7299]|uniref:Rhodopsin domain-containing protein n=1 Tax=Polytolypa hystricis (strain UAMH7299) TaxID=1447883 RepID=A0A2B7YAE7_POLH7|nr:hypothetical protein AJ80_04634 [Polytolypa hystricis UAMH7299]
MTLFLVKMSILFFYLRVFKAEKRVRLFTKIYMGLIILWTIGNILLTFLLCRPFRSYWDIAVKGTCGDKIASFVALGVYNTITDFFILTLPIRTLWKLHLPKPRRFTLIGVFCFGLLVSILSIIRMVAVSRVDLANFPLTAVFSVFWSSVEPNAAVICVCLPMLQPILPRQFRERGDSISMIGDQEDVESPEGRFYMSPSSGGGGGPHILL